MTNDELAALPPDKTQFIEIMQRAFMDYFVDVNEPAFTRARQTPVGAYLWRVSDIVSDINQNITDIKLAERLLSSFAPGFAPLHKDQNAAHLIRYHYENFFLRATKFHDLSLRLINHVMQLGLPTGLGLEGKLVKKLDPAYGKFEVIWKYMNS